MGLHKKVADKKAPAPFLVVVHSACPAEVDANSLADALAASFSLRKNRSAVTVGPALTAAATAANQRLIISAANVILLLLGPPSSCVCEPTLLLAAANARAANVLTFAVCLSYDVASAWAPPAEGTLESEAASQKNDGLGSAEEWWEAVASLVPEGVSDELHLRGYLVSESLEALKEALGVESQPFTWAPGAAQPNITLEQSWPENGIDVELLARGGRTHGEFSEAVKAEQRRPFEGAGVLKAQIASVAAAGTHDIDDMWLCCKEIYTAARRGRPWRAALEAAGACEALVDAADAHKTDGGMQLWACRAAAELARDGDVAAALIAAGAASIAGRAFAALRSRDDLVRKWRTGSTRQGRTSVTGAPSTKQLQSNAETKETNQYDMRVSVEPRGSTTKAGLSAVKMVRKAVQRVHVAETAAMLEEIERQRAEAAAAVELAASENEARILDILAEDSERARADLMLLWEDAKAAEQQALEAAAAKAKRRSLRQKNLAVQGSYALGEEDRRRYEEAFVQIQNSVAAAAAADLERNEEQAKEPVPGDNEATSGISTAVALAALGDESSPDASTLQSLLALVLQSSGAENEVGKEEFVLLSHLTACVRDRQLPLPLSWPPEPPTQEEGGERANSLERTDSAVASGAGKPKADLLESTQAFEVGTVSALAYYLDLCDIFGTGNREPSFVPRVLALAARMLSPEKGADLARAAALPEAALAGRLALLAELEDIRKQRVRRATARERVAASGPNIRPWLLAACQLTTRLCSSDFTARPELNSALEALIAAGVPEGLVLTAKAYHKSSLPLAAAAVAAAAAMGGAAVGTSAFSELLSGFAQPSACGALAAVAAGALEHANALQLSAFNANFEMLVRQDKPKLGERVLSWDDTITRSVQWPGAQEPCPSPAAALRVAAALMAAKPFAALLLADMCEPALDSLSAFENDLEATAMASKCLAHLSLVTGLAVRLCKANAFERIACVLRLVAAAQEKQVAAAAVLAAEAAARRKSLQRDPLLRRKSRIEAPAVREKGRVASVIESNASQWRADVALHGSLALQGLLSVRSSEIGISEEKLLSCAGGIGAVAATFGSDPAVAAGVCDAAVALMEVGGTTGVQALVSDGACEAIVAALTASPTNSRLQCAGVAALAYFMSAASTEDAQDVQEGGEFGEGSAPLLQVQNVQIIASCGGCEAVAHALVVVVASRNVTAICYALKCCGMLAKCGGAACAAALGAASVCVRLVAAADMFPDDFRVRTVCCEAAAAMLGYEGVDSSEEAVEDGAGNGGEFGLPGASADPSLRQSGHEAAPVASADASVASSVLSQGTSVSVATVESTHPYINANRFGKAGLAAMLTKALASSEPSPNEVLWALRAIAALSSDHEENRSRLAAAGAPALVSAVLKQWREAPLLARWAAAAVACMATCTTELCAVFAGERTAAVMLLHPDNLQLQRSGCRTLAAMLKEAWRARNGVAFSGELAARLGAAGACTAVSNALKRFGSERSVIVSVLAAVALLAGCDGGCRVKLGRAGVCALVNTALADQVSSQHTTSSPVHLRWALRAIAALAARSGYNRAALGDAGCCISVVAALNHPDVTGSEADPRLRRWSCEAAAALVADDDPSGNDRRLLVARAPVCLIHALDAAVASARQTTSNRLLAEARACARAALEALARMLTPAQKHKRRPSGDSNFAPTREEHATAEDAAAAATSNAATAVVNALVLWPEELNLVLWGCAAMAWCLAYQRPRTQGMSDVLAKWTEAGACRAAVAALTLGRKKPVAPAWAGTEAAAMVRYQGGVCALYLCRDAAASRSLLDYGIAQAATVILLDKASAPPLRRLMCDVVATLGNHGPGGRRRLCEEPKLANAIVFALRAAVKEQPEQLSLPRSSDARAPLSSVDGDAEATNSNDSCGAACAALRAAAAPLLAVSVLSRHAPAAAALSSAGAQSCVTTALRMAVSPVPRSTETNLALGSANSAVETLLKVSPRKNMSTRPACRCGAACAVQLHALTALWRLSSAGGAPDKAVAAADCGGTVLQAARAMSNQVGNAALQTAGCRLIAELGVSASEVQDLELVCCAITAAAVRHPRDRDLQVAALAAVAALCGVSVQGNVDSERAATASALKDASTIGQNLGRVSSGERRPRSEPSPAALGRAPNFKLALWGSKEKDFDLQRAAAKTFWRMGVQRCARLALDAFSDVNEAFFLALPPLIEAGEALRLSGSTCGASTTTPQHASTTANKSISLAPGKEAQDAILAIITALERGADAHTCEAGLSAILQLATTWRKYAANSKANDSAAATWQERVARGLRRAPRRHPKSEVLRAAAAATLRVLHGPCSETTER